MKFIHAADIHLDNPLTGLSAYPDAPEMLRTATRDAFTKLVAEAIEQQVDFMVIAGNPFLMLDSSPAGIFLAAHSVISTSYSVSSHFF
jgi:hypothetical protein